MKDESYHCERKPYGSSNSRKKKMVPPVEEIVELAITGTSEQIAWMFTGNNQNVGKEMLWRMRLCEKSLKKQQNYFTFVARAANFGSPLEGEQSG